jgi:hypothetical protein
MANIFGFSLKKIKTFRGHDGNGLNADIYYNGKFVAYFTDLADGGDPDIDFIPESKSLKSQMKNNAAELGKKYAARYRNDMLEWDLDRIVAIIVEDICNLINLEKAYKSAMKKNNGREVMFVIPVFAIDNFKNRTGSTYYPCNSTSEMDRDGIIKQLQRDYPDAIEYDIFKSLKCFDIN